MKKRWIVVIAFAAVLSAAGLAVTALLTTETGLNSVLRVAQKFVPGTLSWGTASGRLIGPLQLTALGYADASGDYRIAQLNFDWSPGRLLARRLSVHQLQLEDVQIVLPESADEPEQAPVEPGWALPLELVVQDLAVTRLSVTSGNAEPVVIDAFSLAAKSGLEWVDIEQLQLAMPQLKLALQGRLGLGAQTATDLTLDWTLQAPGYAPLAARGQLSGSFDNLLLQQQLSAPLAAQLQLELQQPFAALRWELELDAPVTALTQINAAWPAQQLGGKLHGSGDLETAEIRADLLTDWAVQQLLPLRVELSLATADDGSLQLQPLLLQHADSSLRLTANWAAETERFSARLDARQFVWPLLGAPQLNIPAAELHAKGTLQDYLLNLSAQVEGEALPPARIDATAHGNQEALRIDQLDVQALAGLIKAQGELAFAPQLRWDIQIDAADINPGEHWPDWPGRLSAQFASSGSSGDAGLALTAQLQQLQGELRGYPVSGRGALAMQDALTRIETLLLQSGAARIELGGSIADSWNLNWAVAAPDLRQVLPSLAGAVDARGTLSGSRAQPRLQARAQVNDLVAPELRLNALQLDADLSLASGAVQSLKGEGKTLRMGERKFDSLSFALRGPLEQHVFELQAQGPADALHLQAQGGWQDSLWQGRIERGDWNVAELGAWTMVEPVGARLSAQQGALERICWRQNSAELCTQFDYDARERRLQAQLREWPLSNLQAYFPPDVHIGAASLGAQVQATLPVQGVALAQAELAVTAGVLQWEDAGKPVETRFGGADAQLQLDGQGLRSTAQVRLTGADQINLQAELPGYQPGVATATQRLQGQLRGEVRDFALVNALVADVDTLSGILQLDADLAGTLGEPVVQGELSLKDGRGFVGAAGVQLEDLQLSLAGDPLDGALQLRGSARSGPGTLQLDGAFTRFGSEQFSGELKLVGSEVEVMNLPEARVLITPDLQCVLRPQSAEVSGTLHIPEARIEPRDLSGAVTASKDVVLVQHGQPPPPGWAVSSRVKLSLGDKVQFNGYGLQGRLAGALDVTDLPNKVPRARGELTVKDGLYTAYGQELNIEQGRVLYRDSPLDNPALDVRAIRKSGSVTAGVRVLGTAQDPQAELYSQPSLPQADVLSYLLLGRPVANASGSEGEMLFKAASSLGLKGGNTLAQNIGNAFGMDEVSVGGGDDLESAALKVGKYLSPRLYINYSVGLLDAANKLQMRYQLSKRLTLQTETGTATGGDLLYSIER